jgi:hypothetical protein
VAREILDRNQQFYNAALASLPPDEAQRIRDENANYLGERQDVLRALAAWEERSEKLDAAKPAGSIVVVLQCMDFRLSAPLMCGGAVYTCSDAGSVLDLAEKSSLLGAFKLARKHQKGVVLLFTTHSDCGKEKILDHIHGPEANGLECLQHQHMSSEVAGEWLNGWLKEHSKEEYEMFISGGAVVLFAEIETNTLLLRNIQLVEPQLPTESSSLEKT